VSAALASVPGVSRWHCGSAVTYQEETKTQWLDVSPEELRRFSAVSLQVTQAMAVGVLQRTPHAQLAVAVTGHLGPAAPTHYDGVIFISILGREMGLESEYSQQVKLDSAGRVARQFEAAAIVFKVSDSCVKQLFDKKNS
jgi:nicotinamide-nucleotide amidase